MNTTVIQLKKETVTKLQQHKKYRRQSYDEVINQLLNEYDAETVTEEELREIERGVADIRAGRIKKIEDVAKEHGIILR